MKVQTDKIQVGPSSQAGVGSYIRKQYIGRFTSDPTSPDAGDFWYNTTDGIWRLYNGSYKTEVGRDT